jgi:hypothetical protein
MSVEIETKPLVPRECFSRECRIRSVVLKETAQRENLEKQLILVKREKESYKEAVVSLFGVISDLFLFLKGRLKQKIESGQLLTLSDIQEINRLLQHLPSQNMTIELFDFLEKYLADLKNRSNIDYIEEIYRYENLLPSKHRISRPRSKHAVDLIQEKIRAIILCEYRRLIRLEGSRFIEGEIDYAEYMRRIEEYTKEAGESYPK